MVVGRLCDDPCREVLRSLCDEESRKEEGMLRWRRWGEGVQGMRRKSSEEEVISAGKGCLTTDDQVCKQPFVQGSQ